jgi:hypothetical protein
VPLSASNNKPLSQALACRNIPGSPYFFYSALAAEGSAFKKSSGLDKYVTMRSLDSPATGLLKRYWLAPQKTARRVEYRPDSF